MLVFLAILNLWASLTLFFISAILVSFTVSVNLVILAIVAFFAKIVNLVIQAFIGQLGHFRLSG